MISNQNNQTELSVTILGSGTCVPSLERSSCSVLIKTLYNNILFDSGPGTMRRLLEAGVEIFDISTIFYSHFHPDHTGELVPFLFSNKYSDEKVRKLPLTIVAGKGFKNFFEKLQNAYGSWIDLGKNMFQIIELDNIKKDQISFNDFKIESIPVEHREESLAYKLITPLNKSVVYSGDTDYSESLIQLAKNTDLLICESAFPDSLKTPGHLTPSLAGKIASQAKVKKLILTHFYPVCASKDIQAECKQTYSGQLELAKDLMEIKL